VTYTFPAQVAWSTASNAAVKNVSFQVYAVTDTTHMTPLAILDANGVAIPGNILSSGTIGVFPQFQQASNATVVITDAAHVYAWTVNCIPSDASTAAFINAAGSATQTALSATYVPAVVVAGFTTAAIHAARDKAGVGGAVFFPAGTYSVTGLSASVAGQTWTFAPGVTLNLASNSNADLIQVSAANVTIQGKAVLDGNATGNTTGGSGGIWTNATGTVYDGFTLQNCRQIGMNVTASRCRMNNVTVLNAGDAGISVTPSSTTTAISDIDIRACTVTNAAVGPYGIRVHGNTAAATVRVIGNHISLPASSTSGLGIEIFGGANKSTVIGNTVIGTRIGISLSGSNDVTATANVVDGANLYGIEIAGCLNVTVSGNAINGEAVTGNGISVSATAKYVTISGNAIQGWITDAIHTTGSDHMTIIGNTINGPAQPIVLQSATKFVVQGNVVNGQGTANDGVNLDGCTDGTVAGNHFDGFTRSGVIIFNGAMTNLIIGPNQLAGTTPNVPLYMSAAIGAGSRAHCGNMTTTTRTGPTYAGVGGTYFDTTLNKPGWSNGTVWTDAAGAAI